LTTSQSAPTQFLLTISELTGVWALPNPRVTFGRCFGDDFWFCSNSVVVDYFWFNKGCGR
jgi:hypothetical protein